MADRPRQLPPRRLAPPGLSEPSEVSTRHELAARLPDIPRWVELRGLLLQDHPSLEIFDEGDFEHGGGDPSFAVRDGGSIFLAGVPPLDAAERIAAAVDLVEIVATLPARATLDRALGQWDHTGIRVHELRDETRLPRDLAHVRFLDAAYIAGLAVVGELRDELEAGAEGSPIAASFVGETPVAFCYAGATTEAWWDVSIDTVPEHRRHGHAARCAAFMIRHMRTLGREPVWQSAEDNPASWKLAAKLGFVAVDRLEYWRREGAT